MDLERLRSRVRALLRRSGFTMGPRAYDPHPDDSSRLAILTRPILAAARYLANGGPPTDLPVRRLSEDDEDLMADDPDGRDVLVLYDAVLQLERAINNKTGQQMNDEQLIADLVATFPGIWARPAREYGRPEYQQGAWVSGEGEIGELPIFNYVSPDPDDYNGNVLQGFENWLANRGYELEHYDSGVWFALPKQREFDA